MLTRQIEGAQKKVEEQNFLIRKRVLEYDDVLNQQREVIYEYRRQILEGMDMSETAKEKMRGVFERLTEEYMVSEVVDDWDLDGLFDQVRQIYEPSFGPESIVAEAITREELTDQLHQDALQRYAEREEELTPEFMRNVERWVLLQIIDERWREHLFEMDYLREGIHLRGFAQIDPLVAYKNEGFKFFGELMDSIWAGFAKYIFHIEVEIAPTEAQIPFRPSSRSSSTRGMSYTGGGPDQPSALYDAAEMGAVPAGVAAEADGGSEVAALPEVETRHVDERDKIGRNDPCWCGSGKKYKKCHGA
jgi:preprotein translocase subunit SecA